MKRNRGNEESQGLIRSMASHEQEDSGGRSMSIELRTWSIHADTQLTNDGLWGGSGRRGTTAVRELLELDWHKIPLEEVLQRLAVSREIGLESAQAKRRLQINGRNVITPPRSKLPRKLLEWIFGGFGSLLLVASIICFVAAYQSRRPLETDVALAVVLIIVLILQSIFNAWQDYSTSRLMSSIKGMVPTRASVFRDSARVDIPVQELVAGDLVYLSLGESVPADLRLMDVSSDLQFDRSILTGESKPVHGSLNITERDFLETKNIALQGTHCICGSGMGVVVQTGDKTAFGRIAKLSSNEPLRLTTLQWELLRFVGIIASMAITVAIIIVILWAAWLRVHQPSITETILLIDVVSIMVAFIPEGLPIAVTLSLRRIASALKKHGILCKSLSIVETLGSVSILCSDKTGTLTQNVMRVQSIAVFDRIFDVDTYRSAINVLGSPATASLAQLASVASICNAAHFEQKLETGNGKGVLGDATDGAILRFADSVTSVELARQRWTDVHKVDFNSKDKFMLKLSKLTSSSSDSLITPLADWDAFTSDSLLLTSKGAPEILLPRCSFVLNPTGGLPIPLSDQARERITGVQEQWAREGQRVLVLTRRILSESEGALLQGLDRRSKEHADIIDGFHRDLVIVGLVGLVDPLKPDIKDTVSTCRKAGIRFFVITGDHPTTAVAIAGQAGIISNTQVLDNFDNLHATEDTIIKPYNKDADDHVTRSIVITGSQLLQINPFQMDQLCQYEEIIFARTTPEQKLRIVNEFQVRGDIVAVTGDGVNDAPSLKAANCGIAMGNGSDIARESADMVLLRDFSAIIVALEYGRLVYDNLKKTVLYLLPAGSFSELMPILLNVIMGLPQMLSNIQMIIICVATDVLPALSLCMEAPESGLLLRKPRNVKNDRLADWRLLLQAFGFLGLLETLCAMSMSFFYLQTHGIHFSTIVFKYGQVVIDNEVYLRAQSVYFFTLVLMQWGNLFATRTRTHSIFQHTPSKNLYLFPAAAAALLLGIFFHYVPWFNKVFQTRPLPLEFFFIPLTFGLSLLILDELRKLVVRKYPRSFLAFVAW